MRRFISFAGVAAIITGVILLANYVLLDGRLSNLLKVDSRNAGINASAHFQYYVVPSVVVFDLKRVSDTNSPADIFRLLLQFASSVKDKNFQEVLLAYRGRVKFRIPGTYFKILGEELGTQNPIYTIRTFPENVYRPDGSHAFGSWSGGLIGVLTHQMEDFSAFNNDWYIADLNSPH